MQFVATFLARKVRDQQKCSQEGLGLPEEVVRNVASRLSIELLRGGSHPRPVNQVHQRAPARGQAHA